MSNPRIMPILFKQNHNMFKKNMRTYWSGKLKTVLSRFNKNYEYKYLSGNTGKKPPVRVEIYREQFSKCLEDYNKSITKSRKHLFKFKEALPIYKEKSIIRNYHKMEPKRIESFSWKKICEMESKKFSSSSRPLTYQKQTVSHQQDPRVLHQSTLKDVPKAIDTEITECHEPQPRSTSPYRISRAALCKMIIADVEKTLCQCITKRFQTHDKYSSSIFKINSIPFQEMRPSKINKQAFTCRDGISTEDIMYPPNIANNFRISNTNFHSSVT